MELAALVLAAFLGLALSWSLNLLVTHLARRPAPPRHHLRSNRAKNGVECEISRLTVKFHVSNILSKLGATSRTEAVALAVQRHLVT